MTIKTSKMYHRIICIIFSVQFSQSCHVKYKEYRHYSDPVFSKADHEEIYNWDESAVIFGHKKFPLIMNYKGQVCRPGRYRFTIEDYGPGVGAAVSNHGILVCGGSNNVWKGPKNPTFGGKVKFEFEKWISLHFSAKIHQYIFNCQKSKIFFCLVLFLEQQRTWLRRASEMGQT